MSTWTLIQVVFDIFATLGFFVIIMRMNRAPKDDPRLSRGLQLLQSKISVLEDLSDRTETQAAQLSAILDQKCREVQAKVQIAEQHVHEIRVSMDRSLEVAKIFQDKIPHQEIIERQNTVKYVQAARMAHQGLSAEQIAKEVDLPKGEIEFIAKVNRDQLMFNEDQLPEWARDQQQQPAPAPVQAAPSAAPTLSEQFAAAQASFNQQVQQQQQAGQQQVQHHQHYPPQPFSPPMPSYQQMPASFVEEEAQESGEERAARLRSEMDLAERSRLVENLSRLQNEMHKVDVQLARETSKHDLSAAFEPQKPETNQLHKLSEDLRKACEEADAENNRSGGLPPLDQLTSIIPQMFAHAQALAPVASAPSVAAPVVTPSFAMQEPAPAAVPMDPAQLRAAAIAKVNAALASAKPPMTPQVQRDANAAAELAAAKAAAAPVAAAKPEKVIRKVEFPRIDMPPR